MNTYTYSQRLEEGSECITVILKQQFNAILNVNNMRNSIISTVTIKEASKTCAYARRPTILLIYIKFLLQVQ